MGGWRPGDPAGARRFVDVGPVPLELGGELERVRVAYETWGDPGAPTVLVEHALTGDAHVAGPAGPGQPTPGWWDGLVGDGRALDPAHVRVLATNVLGGCQGTSPVDRPITIRDQVLVERLVADALGIARFPAVLGGSMGGMRALEWALSYPDRVGAALVLAVGARATADQVGTQTLQIRAITSDPLWHSGSEPVDGLALAREVAHLTYRGERELDVRFGPSGDVMSYLDHHGRKLVGRFDARSYVTLTAAMNTHDVGRGRGGVEAALASSTVPLVVAGVDTDRLYPLRLQQQIADLAAHADGLHVISSPYGHDAFLLEVEQIAPLVERTLKLGS